MGKFSNMMASKLSPTLPSKGPLKPGGPQGIMKKKKKLGFNSSPLAKAFGKG